MKVKGLCTKFLGVVMQKPKMVHLDYYHVLMPGDSVPKVYCFTASVPTDDSRGFYFKDLETGTGFWLNERLDIKFKDIKYIGKEVKSNAIVVSEAVESERRKIIRFVEERRSKK